MIRSTMPFHLSYAFYLFWRGERKEKGGGGGGVNLCSLMARLHISQSFIFILFN